MLGRHPERYTESAEEQPYLPDFEPPVYNPHNIKGGVPLSMIALEAGMWGYALVLAIRPHWAEDLFSSIQATSIGR